MSSKRSTPGLREYAIGNEIVWEVPISDVILTGTNPPGEGAFDSLASLGR